MNSRFSRPPGRLFVCDLWHEHVLVVIVCDGFRLVLRGVGSRLVEPFDISVAVPLNLLVHFIIPVHPLGHTLEGTFCDRFQLSLQWLRGSAERFRHPRPQ